MKKFVAVLAALFCIVCFTGAGWLPLAAPSSGGGSPTWTNITSGGNGACGFVTTCSITGLTVASGFNVMGIGGRQVGGTVDWSNVKLCGTTLTRIVGSGDIAGFPVDLWAGTVTGGTCTASADGSAGSIESLLVGLGLLSNLTSTTATTTCSGDFTGSTNDPNPCSSALTVPANGFAIAFAYGNFAGTGCTVTWVANGGLTMVPDASPTNATKDCASISHFATAGAITPTFNDGGFLAGGIAGATWN